MLGKIEGRRRRGWQRMRWLDNIPNSMDMSFSKPWEIVKNRKVWHAAVHGVSKSWTQPSDWTAAWELIFLLDLSSFENKNRCLTSTLPPFQFSQNIATYGIELSMDSLGCCLSLDRSTLSTAPFPVKALSFHPLSCFPWPSFSVQREGGANSVGQREALMELNAPLPCWLGHLPATSSNPSFTVRTGSGSGRQLLLRWRHMDPETPLGFSDSPKCSTQMFRELCDRTLGPNWQGLRHG